MTQPADTQAQHVGMHAARALVRHHGGAAAVAHLMPRPDGTPKLATTVAHELACTGQYKLGLVDAMELSAGTGGMQILNAFAELMGCGVYHLGYDDVPAEPVALMRQVAQLTASFGDVLTEVSASAADGHISSNELARLESVASDLVTKQQALMRVVRALHADGQRR